MKTIGMVLIVALAFSLSTCGNIQENRNSSENGIVIGALQSEKDSSTKNTRNGNGENNTTNSQNRDRNESVTIAGVNKSSSAGVGSVHSAAFSGKVSGCYYADDNKIIVKADKLYLYYTQNGENIASVDISLEDLYVQTYSDGYLVVGQDIGGGNNGSLMTSQNSNGIMGYLLNKEFGIENTIYFNELLGNDFVLGTEDVAISQDGKQIAFGGLQGLYLYDISTKKVRTILNYSENSTANNMQIVVIDSLAFAGDKTLVYVGKGTSSINGGEESSIYGTVSIDNAKLSITRKADYEVGEVQKGGDLLIMPQSYNKNNGTLLMLDTASNIEKTITFASGSEGKDGVFGSQQGKYVATSTLGDASVTINIYDTASGKVIHTETVKNSNSTYFRRVPQILILDESNTCIVVLGRGIREVDTLLTTFGFEG